MLESLLDFKSGNQKDPYNASAHLKEPTGVTKIIRDKICPGIISFFIFSGNKFVMIDHDGIVINEVTKPTDSEGNLFELYRPCKPYNNGLLATVLHHDDSKHKRSIAMINMRGKIEWMTHPLWLSHDFDITRDNKVYSIIREDKKIKNQKDTTISNNVIVRLDKNGNIEWSWSLIENLKQFSRGDQRQITIEEEKNNNPFHINSIQFVEDDFILKLFGEPIVVLSSRSMNNVFFVGINSGKILYELDELTQGQHNARIINQGLLGENHLLIFDNRNDHPNHNKLGNSRVIEVDIMTSQVVWSYKNKPKDPVFFSPIVGSAQRLLNGNTLICAGYYGRVFEVDMSGEILWDYTNAETNYAANYNEQGPREMFTATKTFEDSQVY